MSLARGPFVASGSFCFCDLDSFFFSGTLLEGSAGWFLLVNDVEELGLWVDEVIEFDIYLLVCGVIVTVCGLFGVLLVDTT